MRNFTDRNGFNEIEVLHSEISNIKMANSLVKLKNWVIKIQNVTFYAFWHDFNGKFCQWHFISGKESPN